ncbi:MAG TPA: SDR family oxidoreductase [Gemmatimonadales bacterium]
MELVAGATGSLGGRIVRELLGRGGRVRALARDRGSAASLEAAGAEVVLGNLKDPPSLRLACRGADIVISTASATRRTDDTPENVDAQGTINLVDAAREAGVRRFVYVSTLGATQDSPVPAFRAKAAAEAHLKQSGMDYVIVQPDAFMDVWFGMLIEGPIAAGHPVTLVGESRGRHSFIAEADLAKLVVAASLNAEVRNVTIALGGPEGITFRDAVTAYEDALGTPVDVRSVPPGSTIPGLPEMVSGIAAAFESYDSLVPMREVGATLGVPLTTARAFASRRVAEGLGRA